MEGPRRPTVADCLTATNSCRRVSAFHPALATIQRKIDAQAVVCHYTKQTPWIVSIHLGTEGLQAVLNQPQASQAENLIAKAVIQQAERVPSDFGQGSRYAMLTQALGYVAAGGCANGPIGVVLADLANRQMDSTRAQSFNSASVADVRDAT